MPEKSEGVLEKRLSHLRPHRTDYRTIRYIPGRVVSLKNAAKQVGCCKDTLRRLIRDLGVPVYWLHGRKSRRDPRLALLKEDLERIVEAYLFPEEEAIR